MKKFLFISLPVLFLVVIVILVKTQCATNIPESVRTETWEVGNTLQTTDTLQAMVTMAPSEVWEFVAARACPEWNSEYVDSLVSPTMNVFENLKYHLSDTVAKLSPGCFFYRDKWDEILSSNGERKVVFKVEPSAEHAEQSYAVLPLVIRRPLPGGVCFESDWEIQVPHKRSDGLGTLADTWNQVRVQGDTISTHILAGYTGITPECKTFRLAGKSVERIEARARGVYLVSEGIIVSMQDTWAVPIGYLASPWVDCTLDRNSYRLPMMDNIVMDEHLFRQIQHTAVGIQQRLLVDRCDSVIAAARARGDGEWVPSALDDWRARLKPDFTSAKTFKELSVCFDLDYFQTEVTIHLRDGSVRQYIHFADYEVDIP